MKASQVPEPSRLVLLSLALCLFVAHATVLAAQGNGAPKKSKAAKFAETSGVWAPPDVDDQTPAVTPGIECPLPEILQRTSGKVKELVANLPDFTATERLEHMELGKNGAWGPAETRVFKYLLELHESSPGMLHSEETRDGGKSLQMFPAGLATLGLPALALAFHPYFVGDYNMVCEGLGQWRGQTAWQVHFEQRPDRLPRLRGFVISHQSYPLKLKGRAWISSDSFQVLHLESDLLQPVPEIRLFREHVAVEYRPVRFPQREAELWLPETAEVHMDYRGHRYRRTHTFSDFMLFGVDVYQRVSDPKNP